MWIFILRVTKGKLNPRKILLNVISAQKAANVEKIVTLSGVSVGLRGCRHTRGHHFRVEEDFIHTSHEDDMDAIAKDLLRTLTSVLSLKMTDRALKGKQL